MASKKYYVVWKGRKPGIFNSWDECKEQVHGFENAAYKAFATLEEANQAYNKPAPVFDFAAKTRPKQNKTSNLPIWSAKKLPALAVDAACSGNPGQMEYRGVDAASGKQFFHYGPISLGTNNIGEFLAIVHGLAFLQKKGAYQMPIYSDSVNAIKWVKQRKANTKLERNENTADLFALIDRAVAWLQNNKYQNEILKWETELWGECPADFGRK